MNKKMRRKDRQMSEADTIKVLKSAQYGTLSMLDTENKPYGIPISFVYENGMIYLHCATAGTKLDNIAHDNNVCFSTVTDVVTIQEKFSTRFKSAIIFGKAELVDSIEEKRTALIAILNKYCHDFYEPGLEYIEKSLAQTNILRIQINDITGKEHK
ncbi:pyridoxamine 5'-phosphate oxidase family protein [Pectinatus frisingensis]|jgi:nitroimidazol reductase NimA-like FMN-containing flavoprotein (pyridoxamine 5'-phosphate oxidase superfamily)|uniref:pyridoxamine 5'-phosphate oxidase family protein n=1 Tax=Pectinatus frisingensis TaxID=865 RepID=UPI0018C692D0|nr:pyridoxamine 5'-phosphate oxidase family protein [Pectinatus frisingensis]